jgi:pimeloyl-ACP methyl ester carboxylesterase
VTQTKPTIVLVHGAWADGSSWTKVIQRLQAAGHEVVALPNTLRGVSADAAVIRTYLDAIDGPVVLVAHSYGGFVITNAATGASNVKALVYVDAFIPDEGQPAAALAGQESALTQALTNPTSTFKVVPIPGAPANVVDTYLLPQVVTGSFAQDVSAEEAALIHATQRPASFAAIAEPSGPPAWKDIPAWAIIGTQDRIIAPDSQRAMAKNAGARVTEIDASHVSMISHPQIVVEVIEEALREVGQLQPARSRRRVLRIRCRWPRRPHRPPCGVVTPRVAATVAMT